MIKNQTKVLITGGGGYIGSVLVNELLKKKFNVTILDKFIFNQKKNNKKFIS